MLDVDRSAFGRLLEISPASAARLAEAIVYSDHRSRL